MKTTLNFVSRGTLRMLRGDLRGDLRVMLSKICDEVEG